VEHLNHADLKTMESRVEKNYYKSLDAFTADFERIISNCKYFNDPKSIYVKCAIKLDQFYKNRLKAVEELQNPPEGSIVK
jgi:histone acetyltransferase